MKLKIRETIRPWVPFTALRVVWSQLDKNSRTVLDVGCGKGEPMKFFNRHKRFFAVGADIFLPYINMCRARKIHDSYVQCDVKNLPFKSASFDTVLCLEVLEHLTRDEGLKLIASLDRIAGRQVILTTPLGRFEQSEYDDNVFQEHKYIWSVNEFKKLGYEVITLGIRDIHNVPPFLQYPLWIIASPFSRIMPKLAGQMVCIKNKK